jgi:hypothetical protein
VHNLNFDGFIFIECLSKKNIRYEILCNKTNLYYLKIYYFKKIVILKCSYKILPIALNKIAKFYNMKKINFPYEFITKENLNYIGEIPDKKY